MSVYLFSDIFRQFKRFFNVDSDKGKETRFLYDVAFGFMPRKFEPTEDDKIIYDEEEEVTEMMNDNSYGLAAGVFTENNGVALRLSKNVRVGIVFVNTYRLISPIAPFGGFKNSGFGRESGMEAIKDYSNIKTTWISTSKESVGDPFIVK